MPLGLYIFKMISLWLVTSVGVGRGRRDQPFSTRDATVKIQMTSTKLDVGPFSVSAHTVHSARVHAHTHKHTHTRHSQTQSLTDTQTHTQTHRQRQRQRQRQRVRLRVRETGRKTETKLEKYFLTSIIINVLHRHCLIEM